MSKASLTLVILFAAALAGLFYWTFTLSQRQDAAGLPGGGNRVSGAPDDSGVRLEEMERKVRSLGMAQQSVEIESAKLKERMEVLEKADVERDLRIAALARGEALPESASPATETVLRTAIEQVLDQRAAEERRQRVERMARGMTRFMLADIQATDAQKEEFVRIVAVYLEGRERLRERMPDEVDNTARDAELALLEEKRDEELLAVFGANDFTKMKERLSRGPGLRPRGERRADPREFPPGRPSPTGGSEGR